MPTDAISLVLVAVAAWLGIGALGIAGLRKLRFVSRVLFPAGAGVGIALAVVAFLAIGAPANAVVLPFGPPGDRTIWRLLALGVVLQFAGHAALAGSYGGWSYGYRYLLPIQPLLLLCAPLALATALSLGAGFSAQAQSNFNGWLCCNMRSDGGWISDINYASAPRVVPAGVPRRRPLVVIGGLGSKGIMFLLTWMPALSSAFSTSSGRLMFSM